MSPPLAFFVGYVWPEPRSSAAGSRQISLMRAFALGGWRVQFGSAAKPSERAELPPHIPRHRLRLNDSSFQSLLRSENPQVVVFDRFVCEEQFGWRTEEALPHSLRIIDLQDLHSLRSAREHALKHTGSAEPADRHTPLALREVAAIWRADLSLVISEAEQNLLEQTYRIPASLLHRLPLMCPLPPSLPPPHLPPFSERRGFVTVGNFRHAPNWDAVRYLHDTIWPLILRKLPGAELRIYGAYPPPKATALHRPERGFNMCGWAAHADAVVGNARVVLAPLRFGAGQKGKLVEAMMCGTPSVTTPIGAEGMDAGLPWPGAVEHDPLEFAMRAAALHEDESQFLTAQRNGWHLLRAAFDENTLAPALLARVEALRADLHAQRQSNFVGAMLRHHQHHSTRYLSKYLELKGKLDTNNP